MGMRAVVFDRIEESPPNLEVMLRDVPMPEYGDSEILYEVAAFGLNQADLLLAQGRHYVVSDLPIRLGYEASGTVVAVGRAVTSVRPGDRVTCIPNAEARYATGGTYAVAEERFLTAWPDGYSALEAAGLWMQYLTAYYPMAELFPVKAGDWVLITAATGGTGIGAIQIARLLGAQVIATTRSPETKGNFLKAHGAQHVVSTGGEQAIEEIRAVTEGKGVRLICDSLGGTLSAKFAQTLADQGIIYVHGGLSGSNDLTIPALTLVHRGAGLYGYSLINELRKPGALERGRDFVLAAIADGILPKPTIDSVFSFDEAPAAYRHMQSGTQRGKIIVDLRHCS